MSYWRTYYHLVWATKGRLPLVRPQDIGAIERAVRLTARNEETLVHALRIVSDHMHVVVSIPPKHAVAHVVGRMKGASSRAVNAARAQPGPTFAWQDEYGVLTFGPQALDAVRTYVLNQDAHHAAGTLLPGLERTADPPAPPTPAPPDPDPDPDPNEP